ncbi:hypothetical protein Acr_00g0069790 [Actinidia rufa]|uniref:Uncharacterized protein n=1 Tax=Actinidia rufa TaxID=165716 RepID=A0A7J0DR12_9ERIC|nr:hypothetical protein Acr_00g0069790 [Actinidia rufa]
MEESNKLPPPWPAAPSCYSAAALGQLEYPSLVHLAPPLLGCFTKNSGHFPSLKNSKDNSY